MSRIRDVFFRLAPSQNLDDTRENQEGALAEFAALRNEVVHALAVQQTIFALQLTSAGAVYTFALASPSRTRLLLILPFTSYALCARYSSAHFGTLAIGRYIRDVLSPRVPGGLLWEAWQERQPRPIGFVGWVSPQFVTFLGPGMIALIWTFPAVFLKTSGLGVPAKVWFGLLWVAAFIVTNMNVSITWRTTARRREIDKGGSRLSTLH
ncbi:hypothetical protein ACFYTQ_24485 [Nocardia sp. NPDC004068]|uniref:hypothetical protein n=1 Tax=Nocardia sp. NPDC004068 TaxID=3364303 RepID=UPI0036783060